MPETPVQSQHQENPLEKEMATHSSILAWEIPWTEESGRLQFMGLKKNQTQLHDSVQFSCSVVSDSLQPHGLQHTRLLCPSPIPGVDSNSCPLSRCCHPTISPSVIPFSSHLQSQHQGLFHWVSSSHQVAKVLEFQLQHQFFQWIPRTWSPLGCTGWISWQSKGLSRVFSSTTVQKHQFFGSQLSYNLTLTSMPNYWKNHRWTFVGKVMPLLLNMLFRLVTVFLPRSKHLLISWLQWF